MIQEEDQIVASPWRLKEPNSSWLNAKNIIRNDEEPKKYLARRNWLRVRSFYWLKMMPNREAKSEF